jgi:Fe-S oxidoreductase
MAETGFTLSRPHKLSETERAELALLGTPLISALASLLNRHLSCAHCRRCTRRCEVLESPALVIGDVESEFERLVGLAPDAQNEAVLLLIQERPELYHALRQCCFCGHCTATCATHMTAAARMREWREPFMAANLMPPDDSKLVMVDNEWHIFSAYRAIYGIAYPEFVQLADAAAGLGDATAAAVGATGRSGGGTMVDTLFFPGCSLVSYAPELMRRIGQWFDEAGYRWAMSDACCGSPLMSAGLFERSKALRHRLLEQIRATGITRVFTVCPGCGEELAEVMDDEVDVVPLPELLLKHMAGGDDTLPNESLGPQGAPLSPSTPPLPPSLTFFDSCHDRFDVRHGTAVRELLKRHLSQTAHIEMEHHGKNTLCCGAGGAVAAYDGEITQRRVWRVIDEARATGADTLVTTCPTCTYTIAQALLGADAERGMASRNYLELVFGQTIDWPTVFAQLETMWTGEYAPWLTQTFF